MAMRPRRMLRGICPFSAPCGFSSYGGKDTTIEFKNIRQKIFQKVTSIPLSSLLKWIHGVLCHRRSPLERRWRGYQTVSKCSVHQSSLYWTSNHVEIRLAWCSTTQTRCCYRFRLLLLSEVADDACQQLEEARTHPRRLSRDSHRAPDLGPNQQHTTNPPFHRRQDTRCC